MKAAPRAAKCVEKMTIARVVTTVPTMMDVRARLWRSGG
jgi:hypothetical protein